MDAKSEKKEKERRSQRKKERRISIEYLIGFIKKKDSI